MFGGANSDAFGGGASGAGFGANATSWSLPGAGVVEDSVRYAIHMVAGNVDDGDTPSPLLEEGSGAQPQPRPQSPEAFLAQCMDAVAPLMCGYLWHRGQFSLAIQPQHGQTQPSRESLWTLEGQTEVILLNDPCCSTMLRLIVYINTIQYI